MSNGVKYILNFRIKRNNNKKNNNISETFPIKHWIRRLEVLYQTDFCTIKSKII